MQTPIAPPGRRRALITGVTGQDGSYLAELLIARGYEVHGLVRRASQFNTGRIDHLFKDEHHPDVRLFLHLGDVTDSSYLAQLFAHVQPDEVYNLAAQSHVRLSFDQPVYTAEVVAVAALRMLEAVRLYATMTGRPVRLYQASSSEMFGDAPAPQSEATAFRPRSPYAVSKAAAHGFAVNYREAYGLYVACGILFNHESPRRGETFVTRKITRGLTRIKEGLQDKLYLGNLDARRDWSHARDAVFAMWLMLQQETPADYVIASGRSHSVRDFLETAAGLLDLDWRQVVAFDPRYLRSTEVDVLEGDASLAREKLGWAPTVSFEELVEEMVASDLALARAERRAGARLDGVTLAPVGKLRLVAP